MAENLTIARPYARAVFDLALETKSLDKWQDMLSAMAVACSDETFLSFLKNSASPESACSALKKLLEGIIDKSAENFISIIGENMRFEVLPEIYQEFLSLRNEYDKVLEAQVISARPLQEDELEVLKKKLLSRYGCKKVTITTSIDPSIIGGAILKIGDEVIDASVKTSLQSLSSTLK